MVYPSSGGTTQAGAALKATKCHFCGELTLGSCKVHRSYRRVEFDCPLVRTSEGERKGALACELGSMRGMQICGFGLRQRGAFVHIRKEHNFSEANLSINVI